MPLKRARRKFDSSPRHMRKIFAWIHRYETHLSAAAMVAGFIVDNIFFTRVDLPITHALFIGYLVIAASAIILWHQLEEYSPEGMSRPRWRSVLPILTQFALGGLWSGFLIFYSRSAEIAASWPFLLVLGAIFLGNEIFRRYHSRLVFTSVLFFFALYSYAIFAIPVLLHSIGTSIFLISGGCAVVVFALFLFILRKAGRMRFIAVVWPIRLGAAAVLIVINLFYFTNILPPLPLALSAGGMYHRVTHTNAGYEAAAEPQSWEVSFGFPPTLHVAPGESLYAFSAVFAPVALDAKILHRWQWYDEGQNKWETSSLVSFSISGGRAGGYRVYSVKQNVQEGKWRVDIETSDGRLIGRLGFMVVPVTAPVPTTKKVLN